MSDKHPIAPDSSSSVIAPSGSSAAGQNNGSPGQGHSSDDGPPMEVDGASGDHVIEWQFYFDTLSPHLSANLGDLATYLGLSSDQLVSIRKEHNTEHERCFNVLWLWLKKGSVRNDTERLTNLRDALKGAGREALAEEDIPTRNMYEYKENVHDKEENVQKGKEALKIAKEVGASSARLGRYFKLEEDQIARIVCSTVDSVEQGQMIVEACIDRKLLNTRKHLCDGLNYIENTLLIEKMNKYWG